MMSGCFFSISRHAIRKYNIHFSFVLKSCHLLMISVLSLAWMVFDWPVCELMPTSMLCNKFRLCCAEFHYIFWLTFIAVILQHQHKMLHSLIGLLPFNDNCTRERFKDLHDHTSQGILMIDCFASSDLRKSLPKVAIMHITNTSFFSSTSLI